MCLDIDPEIKTLKNRVVWKVFDKEAGKIASLYKGAVYPKGKLVERSPGPTTTIMYDGKVFGTRGLHFFRSKALALAEARTWHGTYIAKFAVNPADFMFANKEEAMYERATRIGNFIKVGYGD
jgi:hypothetical protein